MLLSCVSVKTNEHQRCGHDHIESYSSIMFMKILDMTGYQPEVLLFRKVAQLTSSAISWVNVSGLSLGPEEKD